MATLSSVFSASQKAATKVAALATSTSSAELAFGANEIIQINATQDITIKFGAPGLGAAAATDYRLPANSITSWDLGRQLTSIRVFNLSGATAADVYIQALART